MISQWTKLSNGLSSKEWGNYKRTRQGALAVLLLYLYKLHVGCATIILTSPYVHALSLCPITYPHVFSLRPSCFLHVPWRHTFNLHCTCAHHVYTMRNPCPLTSLLTLKTPLDPSRPLVLLDRSRLYHITSRSRVYLLYLFSRCRLIIITTIYTCPNPNPSLSLSTHLSYNSEGESDYSSRATK